MAEHTPESWDWGTCGYDHVRWVHTSIDQFPADSTVAHVRGDSVEEVEARARLVAAAPKLLRACEEMVAYHDLGDGDSAHRIFGAARAAIARAKGGVS